MKPFSFFLIIKRVYLEDYFNYIDHQFYIKKFNYNSYLYNHHFQMIDREGKREKLLEGKNRERKLREKLEGKNTDILNSPRSEIISNVLAEAINSPRNEIIHSPRGDQDHSPRGLTSEKVFDFEEKLDVVENGANEFNSVFDENQKGDDDDVADSSNEKVLFDMQFCDVLYTVLDAVKQQNPLH